MHVYCAAAIVVTLSFVMPAQTTPARGHIRAFGEASVSVKPDLARLNVSVTTEAATAQEASALNATRSTAVFNALEQAVAQSGEIKTLSYVVTPKYTVPREGSPVLAGFTATNTVEVALTDLTITGRMIDTAISAGATRVDSLRLMLKEEESARAQALRLAGQKARARADAIALGVGVRVGPLISAEEGFTSTLTGMDRGAIGTAVTTPVETGTLEVRAQITVQYEALP
jgi:uncharacterized protein YggE